MATLSSEPAQDSYEAHQAGDYAFERGWRGVRAILIVFMVCFFLLGFAVGHGGLIGLMADGIVAALFLAAPLIWKLYRSEGWLRGYHGEIIVSHLLSNLPGTFVVKHDIKITGRKGNIDHLVIGVTGVWIIETKNWSRTFSLRKGRLHAGKDDHQKIVDRAVRNASELRGYLHGRGVDVPWVKVFIVSIHGPVEASKIKFAHAEVIAAGDLVPRIRTSEGRSLPQRTIAAVAAAIG